MMQIYASLIETSKWYQGGVCTRIAASTYAKKKIQICPYIAYCYPLKKLARLPDISAKMSSIIILQWMQQKKSHQKKLDFYNSFEYWKKWAMSLIFFSIAFLTFQYKLATKKDFYLLVQKYTFMTEKNRLT